MTFPSLKISKAKGVSQCLLLFTAFPFIQWTFWKRSSDGTPETIRNHLLTIFSNHFSANKPTTNHFFNSPTNHFLTHSSQRTNKPFSAFPCPFGALPRPVSSPSSAPRKRCRCCSRCFRPRAPARGGRRLRRPRWWGRCLEGGWEAVGGLVWWLKKWLVF